VWRLIAALGVSGLLVVAFGSLAGRDRHSTGLAIDAARLQNTQLSAQQATLRTQSFVLVERLSEDVDRGRWMARVARVPVLAWDGECPRVPAADASSDEISTWLSDQSGRLDALGDELATGQAESAEEQAFVSAPTRALGVPTRTGSALQVADMGSARR